MTATDRFVGGLGLILISGIISAQIAFREWCTSPPCNPSGDGVYACPNFTTCARVPYRNVIAAALFLGTILAVAIWFKVKIRKHVSTAKPLGGYVGRDWG